MSQTPLTDAYLASRCKGENKLSWVEFARGLEEQLWEVIEAWEQNLEHESELDMGIRLCGDTSALRKANDSFERLRLAVVAAKERRCAPK